MRLTLEGRGRDYDEPAATTDMKAVRRMLDEARASRRRVRYLAAHCTQAAEAAAIDQLGAELDAYIDRCLDFMLDGVPALAS